MDAYDRGRRAGRAVDQFLRHRFNSEASPNTLKAYAHHLKHFFTFLAEQQLDWQFNQRLDCFLRLGRSAAKSEWRLFSASHSLVVPYSPRA